MPSRDYRCKDCGHEFESLDRQGTVRRTCPCCHRRALEVVFKQLPAYHDQYSPMHPGKGRGRG